MSTATTRQQKRAPVTLKIKFKSSTLEQFVDRYAVDISQGGIFIRTKSPLEVGTPLRFEFQLKDATPLITGEGTVVWTREYDPGRTGLAPGMGVRFDRLPSDSQRVLNTILEAKKSPAAPAPAPIEEFLDSPTRVAPRDVIAGLAEGSRDDRRVQFGGDEHTPVDAFDEATKVGMLDELVARTATEEEEPIFSSAPRPPSSLDDAIEIEDDATIPIDEPATARKLPELAPLPRIPALPDLATAGAAAHIAITPPPSFPEAEDNDVTNVRLSPLEPAQQSRVDFKNAPTELNMSPPPPMKEPMATMPSLSPPAPGDVSKALDSAGLSGGVHSISTPLGTVETPRAQIPIRRDDEPTQAVQKPPPRPGSGSTIVLMAMAVVVILGAGAGGLWLLKKQDESGQAAKPADPDVAAGGVNAGTGVAAGTAETPADPDGEPELVIDPPGLTAEVVSTTPGATIELVDGDQSGSSPLTLEGLEEGKSYKVAISATGFVTREIELVASAGAKALDAIALVPKPRFIHVTSEPSGSTVYINSLRKGVTPLDVELRGALALAELKVEVRRRGFDTSEDVLDPEESWREEDARMVRDLDVELAKREQIKVVKPIKPANGDGDGDGSGTATSGDGDGSGTAASGDGDGDGSGSAATGDGDGDKGDGDKGDGDGDEGDGDGDKGGDKGGPTPDWAKKKDEGKKTGPVKP